MRRIHEPVGVLCQGGVQAGVENEGTRGVYHSPNTPTAAVFCEVGVKEGGE